MIFCRICEDSIDDKKWIKHVREHKEEFCRKFGLDLKYYYEVGWENVVKAFNPKLIRKEAKKSPQKDLEEFR